MGPFLGTMRRELTKSAGAAGQELLRGIEPELGRRFYYAIERLIRLRFYVFLNRHCFGDGKPLTVADMQPAPKPPEGARLGGRNRFGAAKARASSARSATAQP